MQAKPFPFQVHTIRFPQRFFFLPRPVPRPKAGCFVVWHPLHGILLGRLRSGLASSLKQANVEMLRMGSPSVRTKTQTSVCSSCVPFRLLHADEKFHVAGPSVTFEPEAVLLLLF